MTKPNNNNKPHFPSLLKDYRSGNNNNYHNHHVVNEQQRRRRRSRHSFSSLPEREEEEEQEEGEGNGAGGGEEEVDDGKSSVQFYVRSLLPPATTTATAAVPLSGAPPRTSSSSSSLLPTATSPTPQRRQVRVNIPSGLVASSLERKASIQLKLLQAHQQLFQKQFIQQQTTQTTGVTPLDCFVEDSATATATAPNTASGQLGLTVQPVRPKSAHAGVGGGGGGAVVVKGGDAASKRRSQPMSLPSGPRFASASKGPLIQTHRHHRAPDSPPPPATPPATTSTGPSLWIGNSSSGTTRSSPQTLPVLSRANSQPNGSF